MYLTYDEYIDMGGTLEITAFKRNIDFTEAFIDRYTQSRLHNVSKVSQSVKACCRDLVEYRNSIQISGKSLISKTQSSLNVSESESYSVKNGEETAGEMLEIIVTYLTNETTDNGVPLLYRGASLA